MENQIFNEYVEFNGNRFQIASFKEELNSDSCQPEYVVDVLGIYDDIVKSFYSMQEVIEFITTYKR